MLDVHSHRPVRQAHQHRTGGVAQIEVDVRVLREIGLAEGAEADLRQLPPAVLLPQGVAQDQIGTQGLPALLRLLQPLQPLFATRLPS